jgi:hypothetical protein
LAGIRSLCDRDRVAYFANPLRVTVTFSFWFPLHVTLEAVLAWYKETKNGSYSAVGLSFAG